MHSINQVMHINNGGYTLKRKVFRFLHPAFHIKLCTKKFELFGARYTKTTTGFRPFLQGVVNTNQDTLKVNIV